MRIKEFDFIENTPNSYQSSCGLIRQYCQYITAQIHIDQLPQRIVNPKSYHGIVYRKGRESMLWRWKSDGRQDAGKRTIKVLKHSKDVIKNNLDMLQDPHFTSKSSTYIWMYYISGYQSQESRYAQQNSYQFYKASSLSNGYRVFSHNVSQMIEK